MSAGWRRKKTRTFSFARSPVCRKRISCSPARALKDDFIHALAVTLGVDDRLHMLGALPADDIADLYAAADLFVFPSIWETFGLAAVEAAMVGMPMVVADLPALREVLRGGRSGAGGVRRAARRRGLDCRDRPARLTRAAGGRASRPRSPALWPQIFAAAHDRKLSQPVRRAQQPAERRRDRRLAADRRRKAQP